MGIAKNPTQLIRYFFYYRASFGYAQNNLLRIRIIYLPGNGRTQLRLAKHSTFHSISVFEDYLVGHVKAMTYRFNYGLTTEKMAF